jgi:signal transduction histidine kinase
VIQHDPGETAVIADRARLRQIIRNLLANAVRHGAPPFEIDVTRKGPRVELTVRDGGPGVSLEMQSVIFDKYRAARRDGQPASTGIGLWLSRELARLMGGDLTLAPSTSGAVFVLTLPAADLDLAAGLWGSADARFGTGNGAHLLGGGSD